MRKRILAALAVVVMALSAPLCVYAAEAVESAGQTEALGTMDEISECAVAVTLLDGDGGYTGDALTMSLTDVTGTQSKTVDALLVGSTTNIKVNAPTTYRATFSGLPDGWYVVDEDGSTEISFAASARGSVSLALTVTKTGTPFSADAESPHGEDTADNAGEFILTGPEDGVEVFQGFLNATASMQETDAWDSTLYLLYDLYSSRYSAWLEEFIPGADAEDWDNLNHYEQFIVTEAYVSYMGYLGFGDFDYYYGSLSSFHNTVTNSKSTMIEETDDADADTILAAYIAMADWQYGYIAENGQPYNFIGDVDNMYALCNQLTVEQTEPEETEEDDALWQSILALDEYDEEEGIWAGTMRALSRNMIAILVIAALIIAVYIVYRHRKSLNLSDDRESDSSITRG